MVVDGDDNEFPVKDLSTGAREQVFLGARLGFARLALDDRPAFLVLDDAFQHSDWPRRRRLVEQVLTLVEAGWQVLYFTMDDHIQDLFDTAGQQLGDRYVSLRTAPTELLRRPVIHEHRHQHHRTTSPGRSRPPLATQP